MSNNYFCSCSLFSHIISFSVFKVFCMFNYFFLKNHVLAYFILFSTRPQARLIRAPSPKFILGPRICHFWRPSAVTSPCNSTCCRPLQHACRLASSLFLQQASIIFFMTTPFAAYFFYFPFLQVPLIAAMPRVCRSPMKHAAADSS